MKGLVFGVFETITKLTTTTVCWMKNFLQFFAVLLLLLKGVKLGLEQ